MDSRLRKYLADGMTLAAAAVCAGIDYEEARKQLSTATDDADLDAQRIALASRAEAALQTLSELMDSEDDKVRLTAAKTILELQVKHKPRRIQVETTSDQDDLWSCAARRSVHRDGGQAVELDAVERSSPEESFAGPVSAADDGSQAATADQIAQDPELGSRDGFAGSLDLDSEHLPVGTQNAEDIRPPTDGTRLPDRSVLPSAPGDAFDGQPHPKNASLFDYS